MMSSNWVKNAINEINADHQRSADTHLIRLPLSAFPGIQLYLKDESTHPTGSLKHRLARSLFLYGLCNGWIKEGTPIIEASSGSTAISEAWFARLLGLPFIAVMPACTAKRKIEQIQFYGDNNIADSIFRQMRNELHPVPRFIVMSAGTGGTSATIGRYIRCQGYDTQLMVVDPENSVFLPYWQDRDASLRSASTGTNMWGALQLAARMREAGETGAIVTLLCDSGDRYLDTYYHPAWVSDHIGDLTPWSAAIAKLLTGD